MKFIPAFSTSLSPDLSPSSLFGKQTRKSVEWIPGQFIPLLCKAGLVSLSDWQENVIESGLPGAISSVIFVQFKTFALFSNCKNWGKNSNMVKLYKEKN